MRNLLLTLIIAICFCSCQTKGYQIKGEVPGAPDGLTAWLISLDQYSEAVLDSAAITDGRFTVGSSEPVAHPHRARIVIGRAPLGDRADGDTKAYMFYLDNGQMTFQCIYDSLPGYYWEPRSKEHNVTFTGSAAQDLRNEYNRRVKEYANERERLRSEYLKVYHVPALDGVFNTREGMEIVRKRSALSAKINQIAMDFIREHNNSVVSVDIASDLLYGPTRARFTAEQIDAIMDVFDPSVRTAPAFAQLQETAAEAKDLAYGEKYKDIDLTTRDGKKVKLSEYVKPGQYNMLEFWASWCGPCRGEIPHLRHLFSQVDPGVFNMVSISIDERNADWQKAMEEENMNWTQLNDPVGRSGPVAEVYHINGIPDCLIIDPDGRIVGGNVRGAELDVMIVDLLGDKVHIE